jgi:hypothetical protein
MAGSFFASLVAGRKGSELGIDLGLSFLRRGIRPITPISLEEISGAIMMWRGHDPKNGRP